MSGSPGTFGLATSLMGEVYDEFETSTTYSTRSSTRHRRGYNDSRDRQPPVEWERTLLDLEKLQRENKERLQGSVGRSSVGPGTASPNAHSPAEVSFNGRDVGPSEAERLSASTGPRRRGQSSGQTQERQQRKLDTLFAEHQQNSPSPVPISREEESSAATAKALAADALTPLEDEEPLYTIRPIPRLPLNWHDNEDTAPEPPEAVAASTKPHVVGGNQHLPKRRGMIGATANPSGPVGPTAAAQRSTSPEASLKLATASQPTSSTLPPDAPAAPGTYSKPSDPIHRTASSTAPPPKSLLRACDNSPSPPLETHRTPPSLCITPTDQSLRPKGRGPREAGGSSPPATAPLTQPAQAAKSQDAVSERRCSIGSAQQPSLAKKGGVSASEATYAKTASAATASPTPTAASNRSPTGAATLQLPYQPLSPQLSATAPAKNPKRLPKRVSQGSGTVNQPTAAAAATTSGVSATTSTPQKLISAVRRRSTLSSHSFPSHSQQGAVSPGAPASSPPAKLAKSERVPTEREMSGTGLAFRFGHGSSAVPMTNALTERRRQEALRERRERERQAEEALMRSTPARYQTPATKAGSRLSTSIADRHAHKPSLTTTTTLASAAPRYASPTASFCAAAVRPGSGSPPPDSLVQSSVSSVMPLRQQKPPAAFANHGGPSSRAQPIAAHLSAPASEALQGGSSTCRAANTPMSHSGVPGRRSAGQRHADPKSGDPGPRRSMEKGRYADTASKGASARTGTGTAAVAALISASEPALKGAGRRTPATQELEGKRATGGEEAQPPTTALVPFCIECGHRHIDEGAKYCAFCGHKRECV